MNELQTNDKRNELTLISQEGDKIIFSKDLTKLSDLINNSDLDEDIPLNQITTQTLQKIKQFCELHNYNNDSMNYIFPFKSDKLQEHLDEKSYLFLQEYENIQDITKKIKELAPLLEAGFYLGFTKLKKIINTCIQVSFYCGITTEEQETFKLKWKIQDEDITPDIKKDIIQSYSQLYNGYSTVLKSEIHSIYSKYINNKKK